MMLKAVPLIGVMLGASALVLASAPLPASITSVPLQDPQKPRRRSLLG